MGRRVLISLCLLCLFAPGSGQSNEKIIFTSRFEAFAFSKKDQDNTQSTIDLLLAGDAGTTFQNAESVHYRLQNLIADLKPKHGSKPKPATIRKIHRTIHKKLYSNYSYPATFSSSFTTGQYNCITSTAMMAFILDEIGYSYIIYCSPNHVYLAVPMEHGSTIVETTNRWEGVEYTKEAPGKKGFHEIELIELAGLQYYNQALEYYNYGRDKEARSALIKARLLSDVPFLSLPTSPRFSTEFLSPIEMEESQYTRAQAIIAFHDQDYQLCIEQCESLFRLTEPDVHIQQLYSSALLQSMEGRHDHGTILLELEIKCDSFAFLRNDPSIHSAKARLFLCLAITEFEQDELEKGNTWLKQYEDYARNTEDIMGQHISLIDWAYEAAASCYVRMARYDEAIQSLKTGLLVNENSEMLSRKMVVYSEIRD